VPAASILNFFLRRGRFWILDTCTHVFVATSHRRRKPVSVLPSFRPNTFISALGCEFLLASRRSLRRRRRRLRAFALRRVRVLFYRRKAQTSVGSVATFDVSFCLAFKSIYGPVALLAAALAPLRLRVCVFVCVYPQGSWRRLLLSKILLFTTTVHTAFHFHSSRFLFLYLIVLHSH
jgi:hypothetical protein